MTTRRIGPYELTGTLGRGANGAVFRARLTGASEEAFAIKVLHRQDPRALQRFERERRFLSDPALEGFVRLLDAGESAQGPWLVMPLLPGGDLRRRLQAGPLPADEAIALARSLGRALGTAHEAGIVHRDMKPENVLFDAGGRPLIADLGLARHFQSEPGITRSAALTKTGEMAGTIGYAPREQLENAASVDGSADVFALGAILFECLAGRPAFEGATALEVIDKIGRGDRPRLDRSDVPRHVVAAIERSLDPDAGARFPDGATFAAALSDEAEIGELSSKTSHRAGSARWRSAAWLSVAGLVVSGLVLAHHAVDRSPGERPAGGASAAPTPANTPATTPAAAVVSSAAPVARALVPLYRPKGRGGPPNSIRGFELYQKAQSASAAGDFRGAIELAEEGLDADPENPRLWMIHGRARVAAWLPGALEDAEEALRLDPELVSAWTVKADALAHVGDRKALEAADRCIELEPGKPSPWRERSGTAWTLGDRDRSIEDLRRAIELADSPSFLQLDLKTLAERLVITGRIQEAIAPLSSLAALTPGDVQVWARLSETCWNAKQVEPARDAATRAIELDPKDPKLRHARADALTALGSWREARADCDVWVALTPQDPEAWLYRARVREPLNDWKGAIEDCGRARGLDPKRFDAWYLSAEAHNALGEHEEARKEAEQAIALDPSQPVAWFEKARARRLLGDLEGARADLDQGVAAAPGWFWSYYLRGKVRRELRDFDGAIADHRELLRSSGESSLFLGELARDYIAKGDADEALAAADRAFALDPGTADVLDARGCARLAKGEFVGAKADLDQLLTLVPNQTWHFRDRAWARVNLGDLAGARADIERCEPTPDDPRTFYWRGFIREKLGDRAGAASDFAACLAAGARGATADLARAALARVR